MLQPSETPATVVNSVRFDTRTGVRTIRLIMGDIAGARRDPSVSAIAVSAHASQRLPASGAALDALGYSAGLGPDELEPVFLTAPRHLMGMYRVRGVTGLPLFVVRLPGASREPNVEDQLQLYERGVWTLFGGLAALELRGESFPHVAMTALGAQRGFDPELVVRVLLERAVSWLEHSSHARAVDLYLYNQDHERERWSDALDSALGRSRIHVRSNLLRAVCEELVARLPALLPEERDIRAKVLEPLLKALAGDRPEGIPIQWLTTPCRVFAEYAVERALVRTGYPGKKLPSDLYARIEALRGRIEEWMVHHLHVLRACGNESVHHTPTDRRLTVDDVPAALTSLLRILLWNASHQTS